MQQTILAKSFRSQSKGLKTDYHVGSKVGKTRHSKDAKIDIYRDSYHISSAESRSAFMELIYACTNPLVIGRAVII